MIKKTAFCVIVLMLCLPLSLMAGTVDLPKTGITTCYDEYGTVAACTGTGQDGDIQAGVAWPSTRFTVETDCITDNLTGLTWARAVPSTASADRKTWDAAFTYITTVNAQSLCGHADWRLPNINELQSLNNANEASVLNWLTEEGFTGLGYSYYWSSTSVPSDVGLICPTCAWIVDLTSGVPMISPWSKTQSEFVWPVRGDSAASSAPAKVWRTGQTTPVKSGDDGSLQKGVEWPAGRFTVSGDTNGLAADNLTGLMWTVDAKSPGPDTCTNHGAGMSWQQALDHVECLNNNVYLGHSDWRVPNQEELTSLIDRSRFDPALPLNAPFQNVMGGGAYYYWSSTTSMWGTKNAAWVIEFQLGWGLTKSKRMFNGYYFVWPVRGGTTGPAATATVTVTIGGNKKGTVTADSGTFTCNSRTSTCTGTYTVGTDLTLTAAPNANFAFSAWNGCDSATEEVCHVRITGDKSLAVTFDSRQSVTASPGALNFGLVKTGASSTKTVGVTNSGGSHITVSGVSVEGSTEFAPSFSNCSGIVRGNRNCTVSVVYTPTTYAAKTATLHIFSNDPRKPTVNIRLSAGAVPPKISVTPAAVNLGAVRIGTTSSVPSRVTVKNTGVSDLAFSAIGLASTDLFRISQDNCTGHTLAKNESCTILLTYTPTATTTQTTTLSITSNDPDPKRTTVNVKVSGKGKVR